MVVEDLVGLQAAASSGYVYFTAGLLMLHNLGLGGCWVFGGLTLPGHRDNNINAQNNPYPRFEYLPFIRNSCLSYTSAVVSESMCRMGATALWSGR